MLFFQPLAPESSSLSSIFSALSGGKIDLDIDLPTSDAPSFVNNLLRDFLGGSVVLGPEDFFLEGQSWGEDTREEKDAQQEEEEEEVNL